MKDNLVYVTVPVEDDQMRSIPAGRSYPCRFVLVLTAPADEMVAIERAFRVR